MKLQAYSIVFILYFFGLGGSVLAQTKDEVDVWFKSVAEIKKKAALDFARSEGIYLDPPAQPYITIAWVSRSGHFSEFTTNIPEVTKAVVKVVKGRGSQASTAMISTNLLIENFAAQVKTDWQLTAFKAVIKQIKVFPYRDYYSNDSFYRFREYEGFSNYLRDASGPGRFSMPLDAGLENMTRAFERAKQTEVMLSQLTSRMRAAVLVNSSGMLSEFLYYIEQAPLNPHDWVVNTNLQRFFLVFSQHPRARPNKALFQVLLHQKTLWRPDLRSFPNFDPKGSPCPEIYGGI